MLYKYIYSMVIYRCPKEGGQKYDSKRNMRNAKHQRTY